MRDLAAGFSQHGYRLHDNTVVVDVAGRSIQAGPARTAASAIHELADILEQASFPEDAYPEPDYLTELQGHAEELKKAVGMDALELPRYVSPARHTCGRVIS